MTPSTEEKKGTRRHERRETAFRGHAKKSSRQVAPFSISRLYPGMRTVRPSPSLRGLVKLAACLAVAQTWSCAPEPGQGGPQPDGSTTAGTSGVATGSGGTGTAGTSGVAGATGSGGMVGPGGSSGAAGEGGVGLGGGGAGTSGGAGDGGGQSGAGGTATNRGGAGGGLTGAAGAGGTVGGAGGGRRPGRAPAGRPAAGAVRPVGRQAAGAAPAEPPAAREVGWGARAVAQTRAPSSSARTSASTTTPATAARPRSRWRRDRTGWRWPDGWTSARRACARSRSRPTAARTWSRNVSIPNATGMFVGDPAVAIDGGGTMYAVCQEYVEVLTTGNIRMMTSTDRGATWSAIRTIQNAPDKPWAGGGTADGTVFVSWLGNAAGIKRSLDPARPGDRHSPRQHHSRHRHHGVDHGPGSRPLQPRLESQPAPLPAQQEQRRRPGMPPAISSPTWARSASAAIRGSTRSSASATDPTGRIVAITWSSRMPGGQADDDVWLLYSKDGGDTWTQPSRVNDNTTAPGSSSRGSPSTIAAASTSPGPTSATADRTRPGTRVPQIQREGSNRTSRSPTDAAAATPTSSATTRVSPCRDRTCWWSGRTRAGTAATSISRGRPGRRGLSDARDGEEVGRADRAGGGRVHSCVREKLRLRGRQGSDPGSRAPARRSGPGRQIDRPVAGAPGCRRARTQAPLRPRQDGRSSCCACGSWSGHARATNVRPARPR